MGFDVHVCLDVRGDSGAPFWGEREFYAWEVSLC